MADRILNMPAQLILTVTKYTKFTCALALAFAMSFVMSGCVPKETAVPTSTQSASTPGYAGFTGALTAQTINGTKIKLTWSGATDGAVVAYNIYDATFTFAPKLIKTVTAPSDNITLTGLTPGTYYRLRVRAADVKNKEDGNIVDVPAITYAGATAAVVQGSTSSYIQYADAQNADQVNIYCNQGGSTTDALVASVRNVILTQYLLTGLVAGQNYSCRAALVVGGFVDNNANYIQFTPLGTASRLVFSTQPASATAGVALVPQPVVTIQDTNGNTVSAGPDATAVITLSVSTVSPTTGTVRGNFSVAAHAGIATFTGINLQEAGLKILTATKATTAGLSFGSPALSADSDSFTISPDAISPANSTITAAPTGPLVANGTASYTVSMKLLDQYANPVSGVSPRFTSSNGADVLTQPTHATDTTGIVTGSISSTVVGGIMNNGVRGLSISSPAGLSTVTTTAVFVPGPATQLAFTTQPVTSPAGSSGMTSDVVVAVQDANGNLVAGTDATAMTNIDLALSAAPGGGVLLGTVEVQAFNGVATFTGLGIDKIGSNYKMKASAPAFPTLVQPNSFPFNITAASPTKIGWSSGPATLVSSTSGTTATVCGTYVIQLQDGGNNASNATTNMTLALSSLTAANGSGSALFYNSSNCSGTAITSVPITTGHSSATISVRDPAAETINMTAASTGVAAGIINVKVSPSQFVLSGGPMNALSGACSPAFTITTQGANGNTGVVPADTALAFTFLNAGAASTAVAYTDSTCTQSLGASPAAVTVTSGSSSARVYFKDANAEGPVTVAFSAQGNYVSATTSPSNQTVNFLASQLTMTAPATPIIAGGACVGPFAVKAKDSGGAVVSTAANTLLINGQTSTTKWYTSASCTTPVTQFTLSAGVANLYLADTVVETLSISVSDPTAAPLQMTSSSVTTIKTNPYKLAWSTPSTSTASITTGPLKDTNGDSSVCIPLTLSAEYANGNLIAPLAPIAVNLLGAGNYSALTTTTSAATGAAFFSDNLCSTRISSMMISGSASTTVYFSGLYTGSFSLTGQDAASVVATSSPIVVSVVGDKGWLGTRAGGPSLSNNFTFTFGMGQGITLPRSDGPQNTAVVHFDRSKQYLFVADTISNRIFKYDYINGNYIGWLGGFDPSNTPVTGGASGCLSVTNDRQNVPGWCQGGGGKAVQPQTFGALYTPYAIADDGYNLYVANYNGQSVSMFNMATGAFEGWIGTIYATSYGSLPTGGSSTLQPGTSASASNPNGATLANACSTSLSAGTFTPGFCTGGDNDNSSGNSAYKGSGQMYNMRAMTWANNRLYVASNAQINMYDATPGSPTMGQFLGWIGWVANGSSSYVPTSCLQGSAAQNTQTPSWCIGGNSTLKTAGLTGGFYTPTGVYADVANDWLYVTDSQQIARYHLASGAFDSSRLRTGMVQPWGLTSDGVNLYVADWSRLLMTDATGSAQAGWVGKIGTTAPTSPSACASSYTYQNTPGWCANGLSMSATDEKAFIQLSSVDYDGNGYLVTGQQNWPSVKKFKASTGVYVGQLVTASASPKVWTTTREFASNYGYDDYSFYAPQGSAVDKTNKIMYVVDQNNSRVKKVSTITGETLGWIGGIVSLPTGGDAACTVSGVSPMVASPGYCLGALPNSYWLWNSGYNLIAQTAPGVMYQPSGIAIDTVYVYVTDPNWSRVHRYVASTGVYAGWIGWISAAPSGGTSTCAGTVSGFTPGWCQGGSSTSSVADGGMNYPTGVWVSGGYLYVMDFRNSRINKYLASDGSFVGWVGRMGTNSASCSTETRGSYTYTKGWCKGSATTYSTSQRAINNGDPGGGIASYTNSVNLFVSIDGDSTYFYVPNEWNNRIDRFWLNDGSGHVSGQWSDALNVKYTSGTTTWTNAPGVWGDVYWNSPTYIYPTGLHVDSAHDRIFYTSNQSVVVQRKLSDGSLIGWQGGIASNNPPSTCTPSGTMSGFTPGWCQGGNYTNGYTFGYFSSVNYLAGDDNFVYATDQNQHRLMKIPK